MFYRETPKLGSWIFQLVDTAIKLLKVVQSKIFDLEKNMYKSKYILLL